MGWLLFFLVWTVLAFAAGVYAKTQFNTLAQPLEVAKGAWVLVKSLFQKR